MEKIINIGEKEIKLSNNVAWTMEYQDQFNKDVLETLMPLVSTAVEAISAIITESGTDGLRKIEEIAEAVRGNVFEIMLPLSQLGFTDTIINVVWAMAKAADETIDPPKKWVRQFDEFPLDVIVPEVSELILTGFTSSKNLEGLRKKLENVKKTQPKKTTKKTTKK